MKKAMIVSNPFLPANSPGVRRSVSFIKQLRNYGWEPVVLTRAMAAADSSEDPRELEIPDGMDIYRTNSWEPEELLGVLGRAGKLLGERLLAPDGQRLWEIFARRKAARIVKYDGIDLVFTSSPPKSAHLLGLYLKNRFPHIPWIADIRAESPADPEDARLRRSSFKAGVEKRADRRVCEKADCIVTDSEGILNAVLENSKIQGIGERCFTIPDGHAEELSGVFEKSCRSLAARRMANGAG